MVLVKDTLPRIVSCPMTQFVEDMEAAVGTGDWAAAAQYFTDDVLYRVGHRPPVTGVSGIKDYMEWQNSVVHWQGHTTRSKFSRGPVAYFEVESHFARVADGKEILLPCTDIYTFRDDRIADWRVYADISAFAQG
ncbi:MAG: nuclear transport factor 2 family protein [Pseudomonadota bacterium]